ncbi:hypothetical protein B0920_08075 [Massilia sp. KIM]|uniref:TonB-dependent receptor plug domain-containing protein n=1 Tax=Massilia sp. KIM TaxID=1955422 RepID=UPI00098FBF30|nr:TonB-dependent receptor [Massilia sp. KIM]OON63339.1 hypothetical protein B0920_08075 [Massilia sp. KIM]
MALPYPRFLAVLVAGLCAQASAQDQGVKAGVQQVEVKGGAYDPRRDDTAARIVVGREDIARYGDGSLAEVLKRIPGVTVTSTGGRSTEIRMRGLGGGYTQILLDGERAPAGFSIDNLAPELIERIEVLRVATAEFSTESVAGTINIVLRKTPRKREREFKLGQLLASDFHGPSFSTQVAERGERSSWSFTASGNHDSMSRDWSGYQENVRPDGVTDLLRTTYTPEHGSMNRLNLSPRINWTLEDGDTLAWETLFNSSSFRNHGHARITTYLGAPPQAPDLHTHGEFDDRLLKTSLDWTRSLASGTKLEAKLSAEWSSRKMFVWRLGRDAAGEPESDGSTLSDSHVRGLKSTGKATRTLDGGHLLALGWDLGFSASSDIRAERDRVRVFPPGFLLDEDFRARIGRAALYVQDEWTLNPRLSVYLGTRWEGVRTRVIGSSVVPTTVRSSVLSPIVQTLWKLPGEEGRSDQLRLALSRTYKAPELDSIVPRRSAWENNSATEADYQGNPNLKPELAWGLDAAWEHYWAEGAMVSLSGSLRRIEDYTSNRIYFDGLRWIFTPVNEDRASLRSLELETRFPLKALLEDAPAIELRASVSRHWSEVDSVPGPDNRMEQQIPLSANLGLDYKTGPLAAGASLAHRRGGRIRVTANRTFYRYAHTELEAYAAWTFNPKLLLRLSAANLLAEANAWDLTYADPASGVEKRGWHYPKSVSLRANLEMTF